MIRLGLERPEDPEVLQHVIRPPLPWRPATRTRCGRQVADITPERICTAEEAEAKVKRLGQQRAALFLCMNCISRFHGWPAWDDDPVGAMRNECDAGGWQGYPDRTKPSYVTIESELRAVALLIAAHRDEFDAAIAGLGDVESLNDKRRNRAAAKRYFSG